MLQISLRRAAFCLTAIKATPPALANPRRQGLFLKTTSSLLFHEAARGITHEAPTNEPSWSIASYHAAVTYEALKLDPNNYHLIIINFYANSTMHELEVAIPQDKCVSGFVTDKIHVLCQDDPLDKFLAARFGDISQGKSKKLSLKIARWCAAGKIRSITRMSNPYNRSLYVARVEAGRKVEWVENHRRPYLEQRDIFTELLHEGVVVRLCEGILG